MEKKIRDEIENIILKDRIMTDLHELYSYSYDASFGEYLPEIVIQPKNAKEISELIKLANKYLIPVYPRGSATSLSGGSLPVKGGMVLDLTKLEKKLEIDKENLIAIVSPSVITAEVHKKAKEAGLFYPPDPSSSHVSTIGGNLLENSSGPKGLKYGTTKEYVIGLEVVTPAGDIIRTGGRTVKNVTGYDLTRLIVGSEGTLGIVTEVILRLIPKPQSVKTLVATFDKLVDSGQAITKILSSGILPSAMELMDNGCIRSVENYRPSNLPVNAEAMVIIEVDGHPLAVEEEIHKCEIICYKQGATDVKVAKDERERQEIWTARKMVSPAITQMGPTKISEDATVPRSKIPEMMKRLNQIKEKYQLNLVVFGHAGDGNLHPNIITDKRNVEEMKRVEKAVGEIFEAAISLGGTLSGEHGIGTLKAPYMEMELGEVGLLMMRKIKEAWDPNNIMNPGKIFPDRGQTKVVLT
ncbi:glycolate oxidase subunit GlcD [Vulcanibacillus modesticaldus]|uniref:Glycolate oxidase subunit GlcD n=1 Tax=Vulcanibacillus modesticaldus TaxID=337097 RepID=A0A1D2YTD5_9BACI|nr:FAD-linked oxidase C-terminal domain-containing protein [Vulcanibacillus modesticaldus]OEF98925.1 glycolate oxidase subunit GlcD [Vulcanibacillus modesticaldus]